MGWVLMGEREVHRVEVRSCVVVGKISKWEAASSLQEHAAWPIVTLPTCSALSGHSGAPRRTTAPRPIRLKCRHRSRPNAAGALELERCSPNQASSSVAFPRLELLRTGPRPAQHGTRE